LSSTSILYESLPIVRLGARNADEEVVTAPDFSSAAYMLEEYLALAVTGISIPSSVPEAKSILQFPNLLQKRITIINDDQERNAVSRILHPVMRSLEIREREDGLSFAYPKKMPQKVRRDFDIIRKSLFRLAIGFNHGIRVGISPVDVALHCRSLRDGLAPGDASVVLAQMEGLFGVYGDVDFNAPLPAESTPPELVSLFDRLVNDPCYLALSSSVGELGFPQTRKAALSRIRKQGRKLLTNSLLTKGWNYGGKAIKAWTGTPVPEAETILTFFSGKTLPVLVDLKSARMRAITRWQRSIDSIEPLSASMESYRGVTCIVTGAPPDDWEGGELTSQSFVLGRGTTLNS